MIQVPQVVQTVRRQKSSFHSTIDVDTVRESIRMIIDFLSTVQIALTVMSYDQIHCRRQNLHWAPHRAKMLSNSSLRSKAP